MAKTEKVELVKFEGGPDQSAWTMTRTFPAIGKSVVWDLQKLWSDYGPQGFAHGMKQRTGDFRALDKDLSDKEKDTIAYEKNVAYKEHLESGGDWRMNGERDTTAIVLEAMERLGFKRKDLEKAMEHDAEQAKVWRGKSKVKAMIRKIQAERAAKLAKEAGDEEIEIDLGEEQE